MGLLVVCEGGGRKAYFSYDKSSEDVLCYRPRHWECGGNLHGAAHVENLSEEELYGDLYPDGQKYIEQADPNNLPPRRRALALFCALHAASPGW